MKTVWLALFTLSCGVAAAADCDKDKVPAEVLAAEDVRYRAMVGEDFATLEQVLGDDLVYTHSSTVVDSKKSYINTLRSRKVTYLKTDRSDVKVTPYGCIAIVTGRGDFQVTIDGKEMPVQIRFTNVWEKRSSRWQMVAWQATRIPPKP